MFGFTEVYFAGAIGLIPQKGFPESFRIQPLAWTSAKSWIEKDFNLGEKPEFDKLEDLKGPHAVAAITNRGGTSIVVFGDSDFATDKHFYNGNNSELFLTNINRLTAETEVISVDRKVLPTRRLLMSPEQVRFLHISSIGFFPVFLLIIGGYIRWLRR